MTTRLNRLWGFRSGTPWKRGVALVYYLGCAAFLIIAMATPSPLPAGIRDILVLKASSLILFLWMVSPGVFLSDTPLRNKLPLFKDHRRLRSLVGLMIVCVLFQYLFFLVEDLHTPAYGEAFGQYVNTAFNAFVQAGAAR